MWCLQQTPLSWVWQINNKKWVRDYKKFFSKNVDKQGTKLTWEKQFKSDIVTSPVIQLCLFLSGTQKTSTQSSPCLSPRMSQSPEQPWLNNGHCNTNFLNITPVNKLDIKDMFKQWLFQHVIKLNLHCNAHCLINSHRILFLSQNCINASSEKPHWTLNPFVVKDGWIIKNRYFYYYNAWKVKWGIMIRHNVELAWGYHWCLKIAW